MKPKIKPLGERILVKRAAAEEKTQGGIYLPDSAKDKPREGTVEAVGPGKRNDEGHLLPLSVKEGDRVLFYSYGGTPVKNAAGDEEYLILKEDEILGILN